MRVDGNPEELMEKCMRAVFTFMNIRSTLGVAIATGLLILLPFIPLAEAGRVVSGAELKRLSGVFHAEWKGRKARVQLKRDGTLVARSGTKMDVGRWRVEGNQLCVSFRVWTRGKYKCGTVERHGAWYVGLRKKDGTPRLRFRR